jgi:hypothetical protein
MELCSNAKNANRSIEACIAASKKFEQLKKEEISAIADSDLRFAVMSWIGGLIKEDCSDEYEVILSLPKPCQNVYACCAVEDEICGGGFNQLFLNVTGQLAQIAQEGFLEIGEAELSELLKKALKIYHDNEERLQKYSDGTAESFLASYAEHLFDELDNGISCHEKEFDQLVVAYIRKNKQYFGN